MTALRNRRLIVGIFTSMGGRGLAMLGSIVVFPAALSYLGEAQFGLWMMVVSITSMALFIDMGLGNGLLTRLSGCNGNQDTIGARSYISSAYAALGALAIVLLSVEAIVVFISVQAPWLFGRSAVDSDYVRIFAVCIAAFIIGVPISLIQRVQYAYQQVWLSNAWQIGATVFSVAATLTAIHAKLPGWVVIGAYVVAPLLTLLGSTALYFVRQRPELAPQSQFVTRRHMANLMSLGGRFFVLAVFTSLSLNVDNVIIAHVRGLAEVTSYAVPAKLTSVLAMLVTVICLPLWPANGEAIARGDYAWVRRSTFRMSIISGSTVAVAASVIVILNEPIMLMWMGRTFPDQQLILVALSVHTVLMACASPYFMVLNSLGALKSQVVAWAIYLISTVLLKTMLVEQFGISSVAIISAACYAVILFPAVVMSARRVLVATQEKQAAYR